MASANNYATTTATIPSGLWSQTVPWVMGLVAPAITSTRESPLAAVAARHAKHTALIAGAGPPGRAALCGGVHGGAGKGIAWVGRMVTKGGDVVSPDVHWGVLE